MKYFLLAFIVALFYSVSIPKKQITIIGKVNFDIKNKHYITGLIIEFKSDSLIIAKTSINENGIFKGTVNCETDFDIFYNGIGVGGAYMGNVKLGKSDTISLTFELPARYNKSDDKIICPKCNRSDQIIYIHYGIASGVGLQKNKKESKQDYYGGGCVTSCFSPKYYCKRDNIKF